MYLVMVYVMEQLMLLLVVEQVHLLIYGNQVVLQHQQLVGCVLEYIL